MVPSSTTIAMEQRRRFTVHNQDAEDWVHQRIIYPISDSQWVSPIQVVPKRSGITIMKNQHNELVPMRIQNSWRVCIDYK
ncbi:hypothetical protein CR513_57142, partial [Mucuna pruriens]